MGTAAAGCAIDQPAESQLTSASTVSDYTSVGCTTAVVLGLSKQIAEQANCEHPGDFVSFTAGGNITFTSNAVLPYLAQQAADDLEAVSLTDPLQINSGLRTLAQQYLLVAWHAAGMCGIASAAAVGNSNHEDGRAVDVANYDAVVTTMAAHNWAHDVASDPVHFDHTTSPDKLGEDVHAFQVLWNLNNPTDLIAADGKYGPMTEARLRMAPAEGFPMGATCLTTMPPPPSGVDLLSVAGSDRAPPLTVVHYAMVLKNTGMTDWPEGTLFKLANGATSQLHDKSWKADNVVTAIAAAVPQGQKTTVQFDIKTPDISVDTPISETFALDDGTSTFGMINFAVTVAPNGGPSSGDGGDKMDGQDASGGCNTGGGASWLAALALTGLVRRRRAA